MTRARPIAIGLVVLAAAGAAAQNEDRAVRVERPIVTGGPGARRLAVDVPLLARAQRFASVRPTASGSLRAERGLADLRIYDAESREIPYLLVHPRRDPQLIRGRILPIAATKESSGFEADFGGPSTIDALIVDGLPAPFLKRFVLEGSGDRERWTLLEAEGTLFDLPAERLQQLTVAFPPGPYRYLRVTWNDASSGRLPLPLAVSGRVVAEGGVFAPPLAAPVPAERRPSEPGRSRYRLRLPSAGLPIVAVRLDVRSGHVFRPAAVSEARLEGAYAGPAVLGRATLARVERDGVTAASLRIPIDRPQEAELELVVEDGSNPPLELGGVAIEIAELPWIYFESPGGTLTARYGEPSAAPPSYDLEAVRSGLRLADAPEAAWGEPVETTAPRATTPPEATAAGAPIDPAPFSHKRPIGEGPAGLSILPLDAAVLANSKGIGAAFADVRLVDGQNRQVPYLLERRDEPLSIPLTLRPAAPEVVRLASGGAQNRSVYAASLPYAGLPLQRLVLETTETVFQRGVQVAIERQPDREHRDRWVEVIATAQWRHAAADMPAPAAALSLPTHEAAELLVVVDEGDNRPLPISRAQLLLPSWRLRFFHPGEPLWLVYGHDRLAPPRYDLALLAPRLLGADARDVDAGADTAAPAAAVPPFVTPRVFWIGLAIAVLALLAIIAKLVVASPGAPSQPSPPAP
jgi:hypothetical protein